MTNFDLFHVFFSKSGLIAHAAEQIISTLKKRQLHHDEQAKRVVFETYQVLLFICQNLILELELDLHWVVVQNEKF